jgi:branched-chain amino acid transport system substrate-binding protein
VPKKSEVTVFTSLGARARRLTHVLAITSICALSAAACSSSGGDGGSSGSSSSAGTSNVADKTPTGSPIKIGVIASLTGSQASSSNQGATVAPAWADYVNKKLGGINGHPVQVIVKDDQGQPAAAQSAGKALIAEHVDALLVGSDNLISAYSSDFVAAGIPLVSGPGNGGDWYAKPGLFVTGTDVGSIIGAQVAVGKQFGHAKKFAMLYCSEVAACQQAVAPGKAAAGQLGVGFTSAGVSSTAASYTAVCLSLKQQDVDYIQLDFTTSAAGRLIQSCQQQGYNPTYGTSEQSIGSDLLKISHLSAFGPAGAFPSVADAPAVKTFVDAMKSYAKDDNWREGTASFVWTGLVAIQKALASVSATATVTPKDVTDGLYSFKAETLDGLSPNKLTYTAGKPTAFGGQPCYFVVGVNDGKTTAPNGLTAVCPTT